MENLAVSDGLNEPSSHQTGPPCRRHRPTCRPPPPGCCFLGVLARSAKLSVSNAKTNANSWATMEAQHLTGISRGSLLGELPFHSSASPDRLAACAVFRQMCSLVGQEKRRILVGRLRKGSLWFGVSALVRPLGHKGETQTTHIAGTKLAPICIEETAASQVPRLCGASNVRITLSARGTCLWSHPSKPGPSAERPSKLKDSNRFQTIPANQKQFWWLPIWRKREKNP